MTRMTLSKYLGWDRGGGGGSNSLNFGGQNGVELRMEEKKGKKDIYITSWCTNALRGHLLHPLLTMQRNQQPLFCYFFDHGKKFPQFVHVYVRFIKLLR